MLIDIEKVLGNKRLSQAMLGISKSEFESIVPTFEKILLEKKKAKKRKRAVGAGQKGILKSTKEKLFFILFYIKIYPTFDVAGAIFKAVRSACYAWFEKFLPVFVRRSYSVSQTIEMVVNSLYVWVFKHLIPKFYL